MQLLALLFPVTMKINQLRKLTPEQRRNREIPVQVRSIIVIDKQIEDIRETIAALKQEIKIWLHELLEEFENNPGENVQERLRERDAIVLDLQNTIEMLKGDILSLQDTKQCLLQAQRLPFRVMESYERDRDLEIEEISDSELIPNKKDPPNNE